MNGAPHMTTPAGWYDDPQQPRKQRYWDGNQWTEHFKPAPGLRRYGWVRKDGVWAPDTSHRWIRPSGTADNLGRVIVLVGAWVTAVLTIGYMLPYAIAVTRRLPNFGAIGTLNLLLGWTVIGWIVALVMACSQKGA
jgi:hypothetical protein